MEPVCANAELTKVSGGGFSEDFDRDETDDDAPKFDGSSRCWVDTETDNEVRYARVSDQLQNASVLIDNVAALEVGDTVEFTFNGEPYSRKVQRAQEQMFDSELIGWQLWLEPA